MKVLAWHSFGKLHGSAAGVGTVIDVSEFTKFLGIPIAESEARKFSLNNKFESTGISTTSMPSEI